MWFLFIQSEQVSNWLLRMLYDVIDFSVVTHVYGLGKIGQDNCELGPWTAKRHLGRLCIKVDIHRARGVMDSTTHENNLLRERNDIRLSLIHISEPTRLLSISY